MAIRLDQGFLARIDYLRKAAPVMAERAGVVRELLQFALDAKGVPPGDDLLSSPAPADLIL